MCGLAAAIERADWQTAALYLLLGVTQAASRTPSRTLASLLELLGEDARDPEAKENGSGC